MGVDDDAPSGMCTNSTEPWECDYFRCGELGVSKCQGPTPCTNQTWACVYSMCGISDCVCMSDFGTSFMCQHQADLMEHFGWAVILFQLGLLVSWAILLYLLVVSLRTMWKSLPDKKKTWGKFSEKPDNMSFLCMAVTAPLRVIYALHPKMEFAMFGYLYPEVLQILLEKIPMLFLVTAVLFIILVWMNVVQSTQSMRSVGASKSSKTIRRIVRIAIGFLGVVVVPLAITAAFLPSSGGRQTVELFVNASFALYILVLAVCGPLYAWRITHIISNASSAVQSSKGGVRGSDAQRGLRDKMRRVVRVVMQMNMVGVVLLTSLIWNIVDQNMVEKHLAFYFLIHGSEVVLAVVLYLYNLPQKSKRRGGKMHPSNATSGQSSAASVNSQAPSNSGVTSINETACYTTDSTTPTTAPSSSVVSSDG